MEVRSIQRKGIVLAILATLFSVGLLVMAPPKAEAVTGNCSNGRCTVKLNKAETKAMGQGRGIKTPAWVPGPLRIVLSAAVTVHRWIARQYAAKGYCSAFVLDVRPWMSQGYMAARC
ncbi:hypothetical protein [Nocardioides sp.]|uniref:hypothetical protein n=1 Tax=Nocardioides sp. TaxID=35761 RepID=UPI0039E5C2DB